VIKPKGSCPIRGPQAKGKTGWVNASEPLMMPRHLEPRDGHGTRGAGLAAAKRQALAGDVRRAREHRSPGV